MKLPVPYLLFVGDAVRAKTAQGILLWRPDFCAGQLRLPGAPVDLGIPDVALADAKGLGIGSLLIGAASPGGNLPASWLSILLEALESGLDIVSGLHTRLNDIDVLSDRAASLGRQLFDVRQPVQTFSIGDFAKRPGKRLLTVGTDCSVGKKYTALAIERELRHMGVDADFRATGQTGMLIAGSGIAVDAVVSDFVSAAAETLSPPNSANHWDIIEGQGSIYHPAYGGVTLSLINGSQPDAMVLCSDPTRKTLGDFDLYPQPALEDCIAAYTNAARLTNPNARIVGISFNTSTLDNKEASRLLAATEDRYGVPCVDPIRAGVATLVAEFTESGELPAVTPIVTEHE